MIIMIIIEIYVYIHGKLIYTLNLNGYHWGCPECSKSVDATLINITHPTIQSGISSTNPTVNPPTPRRCIEGFLSQELKSFHLQVLQQTYCTLYISI